MKAFNVQSLKTARRRGAVTQWNVNEGYRGSLYHYRTYAAAGQAQLVFFGETTATAAGGKADTNMELAGMLSRGKSLEVRQVEVQFWPGVNPGRAGLAPAGLDADYLNDVHAVAKSGWLEFKVGDKPIFFDAPIGKFPPSNRLGGFSSLSDSSTAGVSQGATIDYAVPCGAVYACAPIFLEYGQKIEVSLNWPTVVALPSGVAGRIGIVLNGGGYRKAQ